MRFSLGINNNNNMTIKTDKNFLKIHKIMIKLTMVSLIRVDFMIQIIKKDFRHLIVQFHMRKIGAL